MSSDSGDSDLRIAPPTDCVSARTANLVRLFLAVVAVSVLCFPMASSAQFLARLTNPTTSFRVTHQPQVTLAGVTKISVLSFAGDASCSAELVERLTQLLAASDKFEVIDRTSTDAVLREQGFQASGAISPEAQVRIGALLGPAAVFTGQVIRCTVRNLPYQVDEPRRDRNGRIHQNHYARTAATLAVRLSLIDLTTGKRHAGGLIEESDTVSNVADNARPEYPSSEALQSRLFAQAISEASRMILPWHETVSVVVYDDDKCNLKHGTNRLRSSDVQGAILSFRASVESGCGSPSDRKLLAKAYYNLGIALTYSDQRTEALAALRQSSSLQSTGITNEAIQAVNRLNAAEQERASAEAGAVQLGARAATASSQPAVATLTNKDIAELVKAQMPDAVVIARIRNSACKFDVTPAGLIALKQAGASDAVLLEVTDAAAKKCA